ncbi:hypothetical protein [Dactylosporangium matsuzakiense]|uniref:Uncharacterized protein n=1 Tax=Dactylosporangium matsuzakiense TaxID=53360 RepID=A0A9W6KKY6_9ACTN|nr:hypothetical protein [Dactylosporangium matsuzakiense]UWZ44179.1 hypothetical protein Dmats_43475 [Dactylosporangium matsuzakiense]GLL03383.1 hypothetical protein GCM10017581_051280 [Dactylosporangium matsuzakiense]
MAVTDAAWWGVWWPSLLLWAATAGALVVAVSIVVAQVRRYRGFRRIDLERLTFTPSHPDAPVPSAVKVHRGRVRLRDLKSWVLVDCLFERDGARPAFHVRADDEESAAARVRVDCGPASGLRGGIPDGPFPARCLGRVQGWDRAGHELVIDAFAILR